MIVRGRLTTIPDNTAVPDNTEGEVRLLSDNTLIHTLVTSDGWFVWTPNGNPGPFKITWNYPGILREQYSTITGPSGADAIGSYNLAWRAFRDGYVQGVGGELGCSASGSSMNVNVATGVAIVQGILYDRTTAGTVTIPTAHATLPRVDSIVVRVKQNGFSEIGVVQGTPTSGAVWHQNPPTLTQNDDLWEIELARVEVGAGVSVIGSDKVFHGISGFGTGSFRLSASPKLGASSVGTTELATQSVTSPKIADGAVGTSKIVPSAVQTTRIQDGAVTTPKIANDAITGAKIADDAVGPEHVHGVGIEHLNGFLINDPQPGDIIKRAEVPFLGTWWINVPDDTSSADAVSALMPGTEFVATGALSSGTRTLVTMAVGPLQSGVDYAVLVYHGVTIRNQGNTGTVAVRANIAGGPQRTHEYQNVGGVPRWAPVTQTRVVTGTGATINVTGSIQFLTADTTDVRAGWIQCIAIPLNILTGGS